MPFPVPGKIADLLRRATVQILTQSGRRSGNGSGVIISGGRVLTNSHVVEGGAMLTIEDWEGAVVTAQVVRTGPRHDLALLEAERLTSSGLAFSSSAPRNGQPVIAVGNPLGFVGALSTGYVHRVAPVRGMSRVNWIHSDVRLAPGNSGGPLADIHGDLLGLNTMIAGPLSFAIPVDTVQAFLSAKPQRHALGVTARPVSLGNSRDIGLLLLTIERDSSANRASLLAGDIFIGVNGKRLSSVDDLYNAISTEDVLSVDFLRGNSPLVRHVTVQLWTEQAVSAA